MRFISAKTVFQIERRAVARMEKYKQRYPWSKEAGGILLGRLVLNERAIIVEDVTVPDRYDIRRRQFFRRSKHRAQICVDSVWRKSKGIVNYLGEWHTHPEDDPSPSSVDLENWRRITREVQCVQDNLIAIIVGRKQMRAWVLNKKSGLAKELTSARTS